MYLHTWAFTGDKQTGIDLEKLFREFCLKHGIELQTNECGDDPDCVGRQEIPAAMKQGKRVVTIKTIETAFEILDARITALENA